MGIMNKSRFKFRIWDKENKDMICLPRAELYEEFFLRADGVLCLNADTINGDMVEADNDRFELIQSTGLHDCEGKEIWEGDILRDKKGSLVVTIFEDGKFLGKYINAKKMYAIEFSSNTGFKIIGHRFEHPELLGV